MNTEAISQANELRTAGGCHSSNAVVVEVGYKDVASDIDAHAIRIVEPRRNPGALSVAAVGAAKAAGQRGHHCPRKQRKRKDLKVTSVSVAYIRQARCAGCDDY